jgi:tetratricopeptide (TPR) repeat protein
MDLFAQNIDPSQLFISPADQQAQLDNLSNQALSAGIDKYQRKDYEGALQDFQRAMGIAPRSSYSVEAATFLAQSHLKLNNPDDAIRSYKRAIEMDRQRDDVRTSLANLLFSLERYGEAENEYQEAYRLNPNPNTAFSLGQAHMRTERFRDAQEMFEKVIDLAPGAGNGEYGLGQLFNLEGRHEDAIEQLDKAIALRGEGFLDGQLELGFAHADLGNTEKAQEIFEFLEEKDPGLADTLNRYMYKVESPRIEFATAESTFTNKIGARTPVSALDSYLAAANTEKRFTMVFQFGKQMDAASVQNKFNWQINRSESIQPGEKYNFGLKLLDTETAVSIYPDFVIYDASRLQATVNFTIRQNAAADATIDPSHLQFTFSGKDANGLAMDPEADAYMGAVGSN